MRKDHVSSFREVERGATAPQNWRISAEDLTAIRKHYTRSLERVGSKVVLPGSRTSESALPEGILSIHEHVTFNAVFTASTIAQEGDALLSEFVEVVCR